MYTFILLYIKSTILCVIWQLSLPHNNSLCIKIYMVKKIKFNRHVILDFNNIFSFIKVKLLICVKILLLSLVLHFTAKTISAETLIGCFILIIYINYDYFIHRLLYSSTTLFVDYFIKINYILRKIQFYFS